MSSWFLRRSSRAVGRRVQKGSLHAVSLISLSACLLTYLFLSLTHLFHIGNIYFLPIFLHSCVDVTIKWILFYAVLSKITICNWRRSSFQDSRHPPNDANIFKGFWISLGIFSLANKKQSCNFDHQTHLTCDSGYSLTFLRLRSHSLGCSQETLILQNLSLMVLGKRYNQRRNFLKKLTSKFRENIKTSL